jgi:hypothetical protein
MAKLNLKFWRPNNKNTGSAAFVEYDSDRRSLYLSFIAQSSVEEGKKFNNKDKINAKLGLSDIGEILSVINKRTEALGTKTEKDGKTYFSGLIHKQLNTNNSSIIGLSSSNGVYYLSLSAIRDGSQPHRLSVSLSNGDMENLKVFLTHILVDMFKENTNAPAAN